MIVNIKKIFPISHAESGVENYLLNTLDITGFSMDLSQVPWKEIVYIKGKAHAFNGDEHGAVILNSIIMSEQFVSAFCKWENSAETDVLPYKVYTAAKKSLEEFKLLFG